LTSRPSTAQLIEILNSSVNTISVRKLTGTVVKGIRKYKVIIIQIPSTEQYVNSVMGCRVCPSEAPVYQICALSKTLCTEVCKKHKVQMVLGHLISRTKNTPGFIFKFNFLGKFPDMKNVTRKYR
jgi:hypothetical protein